MNKKLMAIPALLALNAGLTNAGVHWSYSGSEGPSNWASLSKDFAACDGKNQSPINIEDPINAELAPIGFSYRKGGHEIINNGHTVQVNYEKGSSIKIDGETFNLLQFHFHAPSENNIKGKSYPLEAHFVHANSKSELAVVAVMFEEGKENRELAKAWEQMPLKAGDKSNLHSAVNAEALLPSSHKYYRFNGSLTTPPCSEGVRWFVMQESVSVSEKQLEEFHHALHEPNNRPIQAINARPVLR